jgi:hypothetical protein
MRRFASVPLLLALPLLTLLTACGNVARGNAPMAPLGNALPYGASVIAARGSYPPPPIDGAELEAKNVQLRLPRGCVPLTSDAFVRTAALVDDDDAELLAACNVAAEGGSGRSRATVVLIRHRLQMETGEDAASSLRHAPGVLSVERTTAASSVAGNAGPEVVLTTSAPASAGARPSASIYFGAHDGLYLLYAEIDGDAESLSAWGESLASALKPTMAARPIRWRAPVGLAPSRSAIGGENKMRLPDTVVVTSRTFGDVIGAPRDADPLDAREAKSILVFRDEAHVGLGGSVYRAKLLAPIASTAGALARLTADARHLGSIEATRTTTKLGDIARVDGERADGTHEVYAAFEDEPGEVTVVRFVVAKGKWAAYAPWIEASLASIERGGAAEPAY